MFMYSVQKFAIIQGLLLTAILVAAPASADTEGWGTIQITQDAYDDLFPRISEHTVVWQGQVNQQDWEILYYDIDTSSVHQLTNNTYDDTEPVICYPFVVWTADCGTGGTSEIWFCDLSAAIPKPVRLTDNNYEDLYPDVSFVSELGLRPRVVWQGNPKGDDWEIFRYDGIATEQLTDDVKDDQLPKVSGEKIVWRNGTATNEWEIYLYDGTGPIRLTDTLYPETRPQISGSTVAWEGFDGSDWDIFAYQRNTIKNVSNNINADDRYPVLNGSLVAWQWGESPQIQVTMFDLEEHILYAFSGTGDDTSPRIYGQEIVWQNLNGAESSIEYKPLTSSRKSFSRYPLVYQHPDVYESIIVWQASQSGKPNSSEIMMSFRCQPELMFDYNDDCKVDFQDFAIFAAAWLECHRQPPVLCDLE
jgi:hypothetical protein